MAAYSSAQQEALKEFKQDIDISMRYRIQVDKN